MIWLRALLIWLLIIAVESLHGTARQLWLAPCVGDFRARQLAVFTGCLLIFTLAWLTIRWQMFISWVLSRNRTLVSWTLPPTSMNTRLAPLTMMSAMSSRASRGSSGP